MFKCSVRAPKGCSAGIKYSFEQLSGPTLVVVDVVIVC